MLERRIFFSLISVQWADDTFELLSDLKKLYLSGETFIFKLINFFVLLLQRIFFKKGYFCNNSMCL